MRFDTKITLYKGNKILMVITNEGRISAEAEIAACNSRIAKGEATHFTIEAISLFGAQYINELRGR